MDRRRYNRDLALNSLHILAPLIPYTHNPPHHPFRVRHTALRTDAATNAAVALEAIAILVLRA